MNMQQQGGGAIEKLLTFFPQQTLYWERAMELGVLGALLLCCAWLVAAAEVHTVYWNSTNKSFQWDDYTVRVSMNDYLDIVCPHYEEEEKLSGGGGGVVERYTLFLVEYEEYASCKPLSKNQVRWECNNPFSPHSPERFREKFQKYTAFSLGKEFKEGHSYYYISKPIHHHGDSCLKLKVDVLSKDGSRPAVSNVHTPRSRILSDEPAEEPPSILKSVANGSCGRPAPLTLFGLLLPLLMAIGL